MEARAQAMEEARGLAGAVEAALTPGTVDRLATLAERLGNVLDTLTSPEVLALAEQVRTSAPALTRLLRRLEELDRTGALDLLLDLAGALGALSHSLSDAMVQRAADTLRSVAEVGDLAVSSGLADRAPALAAALRQAGAEAAADPGRLGLFGLIRALRDPEVQRSLKFLLAVARHVPKALSDDR